MEIYKAKTGESIKSFLANTLLLIVNNGAICVGEYTSYFYFGKRTWSSSSTQIVHQ